jgi:hypothetical protein
MFPIVALGRRATGSAAFSLALMVAVVCAALLFAWLSRTTPRVPLPDGSSPSGSKPVHDAHRDDDRHGQGSQSEPLAGAPSAKAANSDLERIKALQADAARAAIEAEPVDGTVTGRPPFVSELEWEVLLEAAGRNPEMDKQLTHLVNKLLFFKKRKAWMTSATNAVRRRALARELLAQIPAQVGAKAIDPAFADELEHDLQHYLDRAADDDP